ncbi:MAG: acyl-CoA reductase [Crocinitomicaceae bacterium]|nr:acyl-CoA reductase [Crocinitomicaceae bacterium]
MKKINKEIEYLFPNKFDIADFKMIPSQEPFSDDSIDFLEIISKILLCNIKTKLYPDVATFAFYCRKANILKLKEEYVHEDTLRLGRGVIFHIAPSNVPINFAYSLLCGILSGNTNIVRVPSKNFEQIEIIINAIKTISKQVKYEKFSKRIVLVRYDRDNKATNYFSSFCDVRLIWGGDQTIKEIRKNDLPPRSFDITFADRYSLCAINADVYIKEEKKDKITQAFYNDTYLFDQNACTAPHLIIWLGDKKNVKKCKKIFWTKLHNLALQKYEIQAIISVDKLTTLYTHSIKSKNIKKQNSTDNLIWRIELKELAKDIDEYRCTSGYFNEFHAKSILEISKVVNRKYQTLAYYGIDENKLVDFIKESKPSGIDRIVPIGKTLDFSLTWDGYNLIEILSRKINII